MYPNNLNTFRAYLTDEEYKKKHNEKQKIYYEEHKKQINEYQKKWREQHKNKINEYAKKYREEYKKEIYEKNKKYRENNKEKLNEQSKEKITCECGSIVRKSDIAAHRKTLKHIAYIEQKNNVIYN
jgi:membrane protein involved in colicin uptake